ncbi:MAG TPA: hypothetical protein ENN75_04360 [candidate division Zixibacteria bacterium]|nr:hypothetical protein [candidate division Zixibacteria bacterium]
MAKLLHTNLMPEEIAPAGKSSKAKKSAKGMPSSPKKKSSKGKRLYYAIFGAFFIIAVATGAFLLLTSYFESKVEDAVEIVQVPFRPPDNMVMQDGQPVSIDEGDDLDVQPQTQTGQSSEAGLSGGLKEIPWIGAYERILAGIPKSECPISAISSGPEGKLFITLVSICDFGKSSLPGYTFGGVSKVGTSGGKVFVADVSPLEKIDFDPKPVPPYERGALIREIQGLGKTAGLSNIDASALGHESIENGSRYIISVRGEGNFDDIISFTKSVLELEWMLEIGALTVESATGKSLEDGLCRVGLLYRAYDLPPTASPKKEPPLAVEL